MEFRPFYIIFAVLVIVGSSNAVNLTDGLDGLAIGCVVMAALAYMILSYVSGNAVFSKYLFIPFIPGSGELAILCAGIVGAGLGFYGLIVSRPACLWVMWALCL